MKVAAVVPVKLKPRKSSAVRNWPKGCGPLALPVTEPPPPHSDSNPVNPSQPENALSGLPAFPPADAGEEADSFDQVDSLGLLKVVEFVGPGEAVKPVDAEAPKGSRTSGPEMKEQGKRTEVFPSQVVKPESLELSKRDLDQIEPSGAMKTYGVALKRRHSRNYRPRKRRQNLVVRDFPAGCGGNAHRMSRDENSEIIATEKVRGEAKMNDTKLIREKAQEISDRAQVRSALKSIRSENNVDECSEKKILSRIKKLEGRDVEQISIKEARESRPSLDARPQSASKVVDTEGSSSVRKPVDKGPMKHQMEAKVLKRKFLEQGCIAKDQTEGDCASEAYGNRLIVQALMAAPNCPWRHSRKSDVFSSRPVTPKKVRKEGKSQGKSLFSKGVPASRLKNDIDTKDEEGSVLHYEENEKALTVYKKRFELSVNVTPLVPQVGSDNVEISDRNKVKRALRLFQVLCRKLLQEEVAKSKELWRMNRVDLKASRMLKEKNEWVNTGKPILGPVPGVEVGDEFHYRSELSIVGLHRQFQAGIDSLKKDGMLLATSIVFSGGYADDMSISDVLIYSGSGGNTVGVDKQLGDQKLERGNLALKNSIDAKTPVRVIRGFKERKGSKHDARATYTYDGLYIVELYWTVKGRHECSVFKFQLRRMAGQPELALREVERSRKANVREGLCLEDISEGKESMPICAVNTIDDVQPMPFNYTTKNIYPSWYIQTPPRGCDCTDGCLDSETCACAVKNGGEIPFNYIGAIVQAKPLIYECGPSCKCPPSCYNRVSQHGIKMPLEIFKTKSRGWGVRSLYSIPSGSFICEYIGELLKDTEAEKRSNDEYLFDIGLNYEDKSLWEGLPSFIPGLQSSSPCETVEDVGFTIDAAEYGNVGRFINHSCSPNLYAQNVLYDHDDKRMPHVMLFAADNIPPLQELTYHYNYTVDQVLDSDGNIKQKSCYCGSHECTGRLY